MSVNGKKVALLFPGQGSQFIGMGKEFMDADPDAAALMETADRMSGNPIGKLCLEGPMEELTLAANLQPALTAVDLICLQALEKAGVNADYAVGHSLGEFSALCCAGVLTPEETLNVVAARGSLMAREGEKNPGGMRAVLGLNIDEVQEALAAISGKGVVVAANHNCETQIVISGNIPALDAASKAVSQEGAKVIPLNVSIANHSPLVENAIPDFTKVLNDADFKKPQLPILFNVTAQEETDPGKIRALMANQLASMVKWLDIINGLIERDVRIFIEVGPKKVLSGLLRKIIPRGYEHVSAQFDTPEKLEACLAKILG